MLPPQPLSLLALLISCHTYFSNILWRAVLCEYQYKKRERYKYSYIQFREENSHSGLKVGQAAQSTEPWTAIRHPRPSLAIANKPNVPEVSPYKQVDKIALLLFIGRVLKLAAHFHNLQILCFWKYTLSLRDFHIEIYSNHFLPCTLLSIDKTLKYACEYDSKTTTIDSMKFSQSHYKGGHNIPPHSHTYTDSRLL